MKEFGEVLTPYLFLSPSSTRNAVFRSRWGAGKIKGTSDFPSLYLRVAGEMGYPQDVTLIDIALLGISRGYCPGGLSASS